MTKYYFSAHKIKMIEILNIETIEYMYISGY